MVKENLFKLIRAEDVVLWAGAGLSIYAGYPSGNELTKLINDRIEESMGALAPKSASLMEAAENLVLLQRGSRNELNNLLFETFRKEPIKNNVHKLLTKIPHFKTIVTTNYDGLFEKVYGANARSIYRPEQVASLGQSDVEIFKAHGDLSDLNSLIITKSDYGRFFSDDTERNLLWNTIRDRISRHAILFVGYSLSDANVIMVLDKVLKELGTNRKQIFFVCPKISTFEKLNLESKNIQYIECTGEKLIKDVLANLQEHVTDDFRKKKVSIETASKFLAGQNITSKLSLQDGKPVISEVYSVKKNQIGRLTFSLSESDDLNDKIREYIRGERIGSLTIPEQNIIKTTFWIGKTKISDELGSFTISTVPSGSWAVDLRFADGFECQNLTVEAYRLDQQLTLHLRLPNVFIELIIEDDKQQEGGWIWTLNYTQNDICGRMTEQVKDFTLLSKLVAGEKFSVFREGRFVRSWALCSEQLVTPINTYLRVFKTCRAIELAYNRTFLNVGFGEIGKDSIAVINQIHNAANNWTVAEEFDQTVFPFEDDAIEGKRQRELVLSYGNRNVRLITKACEEVTVFGESFNLGYRVQEIIKPILVNKSRVSSGKDDFAIFRSQVGKQVIFFQRTE